MCGKAPPYRLAFNCMWGSAPNLGAARTMEKVYRKVKTFRTSGGGAEEITNPTTVSHNSSNEIVFLGFRDQNIDKCTRLRNKILRHVVNQNASVDIRRLSFHPPLP
jgi:hypothetical protein